MRRKRKHAITWLLSLVTVVSVVFIGLTSIASADDDYAITNFDQQIQIQSDGSAKVDLKTTYKFDDDMNGVYMQQGLGDDVVLAGTPKVTVNNRPVTPYSDESKKGLKIEDTSNSEKGVRFKLYNPVKSGDTATIEWQYTLNNVAKRYQDVGELNWRVVGGNWMVPFDKMRVSVTFPNAPLKDEKTWQHGLSKQEGKYENKTGRWLYEDTDYPEEQPLELHMIFDPATLNDAKVIPEKKRSEIEAQEQALADREAKRVRQYQYFQIGLFVLIAAGYVYLRRYWQKTQALSAFERDQERQYDLPSNDLPATIGRQLYDNDLDDQVTLSATLMDLIARHYVEIEDLTPHKSGRRKQFILTLKKPVDDLQVFEQTALVLVFQQPLQVGISIESNKLERKRNSEKKKYAKDIKKYHQQLVKVYPDTLIDRPVRQQLDQNNMIQCCFFGVLAVMQVMLLLTNEGAVNYIYGLLGGAMMGIGMTLLLVRRSVHKFAYTTVGRPIALEWHQFGNMLDHIGQMSKREIDEVVLWDRYFAYAIILDKADKVSAALEKLDNSQNTDFATSQVSTTASMIFAYQLFGPNVLGNNLPSTSSGSGASGSGFGGGGTSGGFGGSSGGGAF